MNPQQLRLGLETAEAVLFGELKYPGAGERANGLWRNFDSGHVGLWQPENQDWAMVQGKPLLLNLQDVEILGAQAQAVVEAGANAQLYVEPGSEYFFATQISESMRAQARAMIANPGAESMSEQYRNTRFTAARREQFSIKGDWAGKMRNQHPQIYEKIVSAARELGIPEAIALSVVNMESGGNPEARGDNDKAVGVYQLHEAAAADMGLRPEERRDPDKNIRAGLGYLKARYQQLGDWEKALMGYNGGPGVALDNPQARAYAARVMAGVERRF